MILHFVGIGGWLVVSIMWNDRSLIVVNAGALSIFANGMLSYCMKVWG